MRLSQIVSGKEIELIQGDLETDITGITINSKDIKPGNMFIAIKGAQADGHNYIKEAVAGGAAAVLLEDPAFIGQIDKNVAVLQSSNTHRDLGILASGFYGNPGEKLKLIGVTGTKGKTSTVEMIRSLLASNGKSVGVIDTLGIKYNSQDYIITANTTPDSLTIQKTLRDMLDSNIEYVILETSSQAFKLYRTSGLKFDIGVFLNIDDDHISPNEHHSFEEYLNCKLKLFDQSEKIIVNRSDKLWDYLSDDIKERAVTFSTDDERADYYSRDIKLYKKNLKLCSSFTLKGKGEGSGVLEVLGKFNIANSLAALATCHQLGIPIDECLNNLGKIRLEGRVDLFEEALLTGRTILFDFAHNRLSADTILASLKEYHPKRVICVFSIFHDETKMRYYALGFSSGKNADMSVLTTGSLGDFSFEEVNREVIRGLEDSKGEFVIIPDRKEAYKFALDLMDKDDILLIMNLSDHDSGGSAILDSDYLNAYLKELPVLN